MKRFNENNKRKKILIIIILLVILILSTVFTISNSVKLENGVEVKPQTDLTYYLDVSYNGVDKYGVQSNKNTTSEIRSGYLYVTDKIPEGLIFNGFVPTKDGTIGAVKKSDGSACLGKVIDDTDGTETLNSYHGLHYDESTRTVSFKVKNLQAGCVLTVGIKTITPSIDDPNTDEVETRRDFYNFANSQENNQTIDSNTVHVFMGNEFLDLYEVKYEYDGEIPSNAPSLPKTTTYAAGTKVGVATNVSVNGYKFSGWSSNEVTITNGSFKMPAAKVILKGSFTKETSYKVTYKINGVIPEGYVLPIEKEYYPKNTVKIDVLKKGDVINGYRFLGWTSSDIKIDEENNFEMPSKNVVLTGKFEEDKYTVSYDFYDSSLPANSAFLIPSSSSFSPGEKVTLPKVNNTETHDFVGWNKENNFEMPKENITVYGEWKENSIIVSPNIKKEIIDKKDYYRPGEKVAYKITVTNDESVTLNEITVKEFNEKASFINGENYILRTDHIAEITELKPGESIELYAEYQVTESDSGEIKNEVQIIGLTGTDNYELPNEKIVSYVTFNTLPTLEICEVTENSNLTTEFNYVITNNTKNYNLKTPENTCRTIKLELGRNKISQDKIEKYELLKVDGKIKENNEIIDAKLNEYYKVTFTNKLLVGNPNTSNILTKILIPLVLILIISITTITILVVKNKKTQNQN